MDVRTVIQKILDDTLLPYGVLSNHLRRVDADYIENSDVAVNKDEYVVFRVVSNRPHTFGDGACFPRVYRRQLLLLVRKDRPALYGRTSTLASGQKRGFE